MSDKYRILHLEDVATDAELVKRELKGSNILFDYLVIDTEKEYIKALDEFAPDVILSDHTLPYFNSFEALKIIKERKLNIPFIVVTATMTEDVAKTIVREGADDFILKDRLKRLPHAVLNAIEKYRFEKGRKQLIDEAYEKEAISKKLLERLSNKILLATKAAGVGIWEYNIQTNKFIADEIMLMLYGIKEDDFDDSYTSWLQYLCADDRERINNQFEDGLKTSAEFTIEFRIIHPDKSLHYIEGSAIVERDKEGKPVRLVGTNQDVTARKKAEQAIQLHTTEREMLIADLGSSIKDYKQFTLITSHNFKAPLSNLITLLSLVDYSSLTEANKQVAEMFKVSTFKLNKTINDLLQSLNIKNNVNVNIANNDIPVMLDEVCSLLAGDINQTGCVISRDLQITAINFNKSYLESILINLLSNAIKYRSPNRSLQIDISTEQKPNGEVVMIVKDNGIGLDMDMNGDRVFGLYQRFHTNSDSVGLGLFIVKSQINALGGNIYVKSEVNKGSSFYITFKNELVSAA